MDISEFTNFITLALMPGKTGFVFYLFFFEKLVYMDCPKSIQSKTLLILTTL